MYPFATWYNEKGWHVIAPDMRCQGESQGDFIGMGWTDRKDNLLWLDYILEQDPEAQIVIHGQSMGAACALMMTGDGELPDSVKAVSYTHLDVYKRQGYFFFLQHLAVTQTLKGTCI